MTLIHYREQTTKIIFSFSLLFSLSSLSDFILWRRDSDFILIVWICFSFSRAVRKEDRPIENLELHITTQHKRRMCTSIIRVSK
jgi:hypothetical protein